jgi:hypothetical protein
LALLRAPQVKLLKCLVDNIVVDISFNQIGGLITLNFLEEINSLISNNNIFKRSIILVRIPLAVAAAAAAAASWIFTPAACTWQMRDRATCCCALLHMCRWRRANSTCADVAAADQGVVLL